MTRLVMGRRLRPLRALSRALVGALVLGALASPTALAHDGDDVQINLASGATAVTASGAGIDGSRAATVCTTKPITWAQPLAGSQWIGSVADCTAQPVGEQRYSVTFALRADLSGLEHLRLTGAVLSDDSVTVQLNGSTIFGGGGWEGADAFGMTDRALFRAGDNTLTFILNNSGGAGGIDFVAAVRAGEHDHDDDGDHAAAVSDMAKCKNGGWEGLGYRNQGQCVSAAVRHEG